MNKQLILLTSLLSLALSQLLFAGPADPVAFTDASKTEYPESIAIDSKGNIYLSMVATGVVKKITPTGVQSVYTTIKDDYILGLAFDAAENLFVVGGTGVWKVTPTGVISLYAAIPGDNDNDLAFAPDGSLYVTNQLDNTSSEIWKVDAKGSARKWVSSATIAQLTPRASFMPQPIGANGIAIDPSGKSLYVTNTSAGRLVEIKINADGSPGAARTIVETDALIGADGLRIDGAGNFYIAVNLLNRITKVTPDGRLIDLASGGLLSFPTGIALATVGGRQTIYVCNNGNFFFGATQSNQGLLKISDPDPSRLIEVSMRGQVGAGGDIMISGFIIGGTSPKTVLVRAVGPTLGAFGVTNALADPRVDIYGTASPTTPIASNDNWNGDAPIAAAAVASGAFAMSNATSKDAALLVTLEPGTYTARVSGVGGATGTALLEIYEVP